MKRLGISLYPDQSSFEENKAYLDLAHQYGYTRIFTSLLQLLGKMVKICWLSFARQSIMPISLGLRRSLILIRRCSRS